MHLLSLGTKRLTLVLGILASVAWTAFITTDTSPRYWDPGQWIAFFIILIFSAAAPRLIALVIAWIAEGYGYGAPRSKPTQQQARPMAIAPTHGGRLNSVFVCLALVLLAFTFSIATTLVLEAVGERDKSALIFAILIGTVVWLFWKNPLSLGQRTVAFLVIAATACPVSIAASLIGTQINLGFRTPTSALVGALVAMLPPVLAAYYVGLQLRRRLQ